MTVTGGWLVTGGTRGIGRAVVDHVTKSGGAVAVLARTPATEPYASDDVLEIPTDVTDSASVDVALARAREHLGGVDVVVNCAGVHRGGRIADLARHRWDEVLTTNLTGAYEVCHAAVPRLAPGAAIVNVGAVVGFRGFPGDSAYASAKAGLAGLTRSLAVELAPAGVRVNLVVPGFVDTAMTAGLSTSARNRIVAAIPAGRTGSAEEIADVVVAVAGASYMTGAVVPVDGGLMATFGGTA
ncbi:SDR family oxidoreductase [Actinomycetospora lutea]|uniref:SDR family NAD(P)-dependent oxidoreductase n=1 Tax=Actinomycetospora lutea TaxID=663604 RepID=UPI002366FB91|nr:SDR family oxidoreductase [Actinomycetospora lutea]MDD7942744.1 SDR family oxidoreductase [Actinomycetospora lutea]